MSAESLQSGAGSIRVSGPDSQKVKKKPEPQGKEGQFRVARVVQERRLPSELLLPGQVKLTSRVKRGLHNLSGEDEHELLSPLVEPGQPTSMLFDTSEIPPFSAEPDLLSSNEFDPYESVLQFASEEPRADPILRAFSKKDDRWLRENDRLAATIVKQYPLVLRDVSTKLQADADFVLPVISQEPSAFKFAANSLRGDSDFVLKAVSLNGLILEHAFPNVRLNKEVVLAAVKQNKLALRYAAEALQKDPDILRATGEQVEPIGAMYLEKLTPLKEEETHVKISPIYYRYKSLIAQNQGEKVNLNNKSIMPIIVKVNNLDMWKSLGLATGSAIPGRNLWTCTARVPFERIEKLLELPFIQSIQMSESIHAEGLQSAKMESAQLEPAKRKREETQTEIDGVSEERPQKRPRKSDKTDR